jgi:NADH:ubiquinone oxidoreductase subunit F (NADH-binding)/(2Fe-2S) ferredoxin/NAD-dependent dihydropyrimidine dehydrogenase PreA subunit
VIASVVEKLGSAQQLAQLREKLRGELGRYTTTIAVCGGTGCQAYGCQEVISAFASEVQRRGLEGKVRVQPTGCHGFCEKGPLAVIHPGGLFYQQIKIEDVPEIVEKTVIGGQVIDRLLYRPPGVKTPVQLEADVPFYKHQQRIIFGGNGLIDPTSLEEYVAIGGYEALAKVLGGMSPEQVIEQVSRSGLRGRGGGGFPTGRKWQVARAQSGQKKFIICNADEGDPGAYMDRSLLEGNPHSILEGMLIGAFAIGSDEGYVYVRAEYPLACRHILIAIEQAQNYGLLGNNILGSKFGFRVRVSRGAGAFVCGEETALIASIEGRLGNPSPKPPYPAQRGLFGKPTCINNVETWANVPLIVNRGADWYAGIGTEKSKGTKIFSLVGKINNTGLVEVPMGISLREVVYTIGGGVPKGRTFKAVQTGGPSGGMIPESLLDLKVDYDELTKVGAIMGSGGMIVMDDRTCIVDVARYFMNLLREESCGKCTPCREGIKNMLGILTGICQGKGMLEDIGRLEHLAGGIKAASLCGLGQTAPNPVLSALKYFRDEYLAHVVEKRCPAGVCTALIHLSVVDEKCKFCGKCVKICPVKCISGGAKKVPAKIDADKCIRCRACFETCPFDAVAIK